ncbi:MAG: hypothetical protein M3Z16_01755 [Pseudomonadota bacterium]|nr:hypothetical protein [Pseudomonadota bacterium]
MPKNASLAAACVLLTVALGASAQPAMHTFTIMDPVLQMPAWSLSLPAGWDAQGTMLPGNSCISATSPTYRAARADRLAGAYMLPRVGWAWGPGTKPGPDCLPRHEPMSAHDYLNTVIATEHLGYVRDEPTPELEGLREFLRAQGQRSNGMQRGSADAARYRVRYEVRGMDVEESIAVTITCLDSQVLGLGMQHSCSALVTRWFAPLGQLDGLMPTFHAMNMTLNPAWMQQWTSAMQRRFATLSAQQTKTMLAQGQVAQAARTRQQQTFMSNFQKQGEARNQAFKAGQYQKQHHSDDFVDFISDCSRIYSGNERLSVGANCPNRQTY